MKQLYSSNFPTPSYLAMNSFALDISDQSIKYGEIISTSHGLRLGRFGKEKFPAGVVVSGKIENEEKLVEILKSLKKRLHLNFVRVSLPEEQMYLFTISLPKTNDGDLRDVILLQMEEHIPLKAIDTVFDYDIISETNNTLFIEVVAIATTTIESYLSIFKRAGLTPLSFELEAQAIARAVVPINDPMPVMIVDFGDTRTGVSIVDGGKLFFTTTLDIGGFNITNMIAKNFSLPFEKAEEMKVTYGRGGTSETNEDMFSVVLSGVSVLRDEINKQYVYWKTHDNDSGIKHEPIGRVILCGGDSNLVGLSSYLEASLSIKVECANAWVNISDMNVSIPDMSFEESLGYVTVLGLSLGDYLRPSQSLMNVLPPEEKQLLKKEYHMRVANVSLALLALVILLSSALLLPSYFFSSSKESLAENRLEDFNKANPEISVHNIDSMVGDINNKLGILDRGKPAHQVSEKVLGALLSGRPKGITFSQILYGQDSSGKFQINIRGTASGRTVLRDFKSSLDSNPDYLSVDLPISDFLARTDINFNISITLK